ncbi:BEN domain-containing protein 3, partial [Clarias magur]
EMSSSEFGIQLDGDTPDEEVKVEKDTDDTEDTETKQNLDEKSLNCFSQRIAKRSASHSAVGVHSEQNQSTDRKKLK